MVVIRAAVILQLDLNLMALICPLFVSSFDIFSFFYGHLPASCVSVNSTWFIRSALDQLPQTLHFIIMWVWFFFSRMGNLTSSHPRGLSSTACLQYVQVGPATYKQYVTLLGMVVCSGSLCNLFLVVRVSQAYVFSYGYTTMTFCLSDPIHVLPEDFRVKNLSCSTPRSDMCEYMCSQTNINMNKSVTRPCNVSGVCPSSVDCMKMGLKSEALTLHSF